MARKFFYVSAAILMLSATYHLGARTAVAQIGGSTVAGICPMDGNHITVVTQSGDVWYTLNGSYASLDARYGGNIFNAPTAVTPTTLGRVKATYR